MDEEIIDFSHDSDKAIFDLSISHVYWNDSREPEEDMYDGHGRLLSNDVYDGHGCLIGNM